MLNYPAVYKLSKERERHKLHMAMRVNTKTLLQWAHFARQKVNEEENGCRFEVQWDEHWMHTRDLHSAVRERLFEFLIIFLD